MDNSKFYVTTFCNFAHRLEDGKPLDHECYVIPPSFLKQERENDTWPQGEREQWSRVRRIHRGIRTRIE